MDLASPLKKAASLLQSAASAVMPGSSPVVSAPPPTPAGDSGKHMPHTGLTDANNAKLTQLLGFESGALAAHKAQGGVCPFMQLQSGMSYMDDDNSLKAGARGPSLLEDQIHREKINHFDHERIPERVIHARGAGAHGYFQMTESLSDLSCAEVFADPSVKTPVFVRFSTVGGSRGSADTVRDVRGFAVKFYTSQGNWDLVGNNIPVFFVQDAMKFPDLIHAAKPDTQTEMPQAQTAHDNFWDFISWSPETLHTLFWAMSDRGIPRSYRMMQGFGVHSFVLVNAAGERTFFKAHWRPHLGVHGLAWDECLKLNGADPDFHRRDLYDNISAGNFPVWDFGVQCVREADEHKFDFDILDATKIIPEELVPIRWCGKMTLDRLPSDYFAEVEQVAFCTSNVVPGIDFSNDPLLQGRNFSYLDTQLSRLGGVNFAQIPINRPLFKPQNNQRDGHMQMNIATDKLNYFPNRNTAKGAGPRPGNGGESQGKIASNKHATPAQAFVSSAQALAGIKERLKAPKFFERVNQVRLFYNSQTAAEKAHITAAISFELSKVNDVGVRERVVALVNEIDHALAAAIAENSGTAAPGKAASENDGRQSAFLSMVNSPYSPATTCATRKVAVLLADGYRAADLVALKGALEKEGALLVPVGVRRGKLFAEGETVVPQASQPSADPVNSKPDASGKSVEPPFTLVNSKSVMFDALVLIGGAKNVSALQANGAANAWVAETLKHCKAVGAAGDAVKLLQYPAGLASITVSDSKATVEDGVVTGPAADAAFAQSFINELKKHRAWDRKNVDALPA